MKVFHHNDHDGRLSAFLVRHFVLKHFPLTKIAFIETNFDQLFPIHLVDRDETVWIVDFSIEPEMMTNLISIAGDVCWIDHHGTAIEKYEHELNTPMDVIDGLRSVDHAACVLTYMYCHKKYEKRRHRSIPWFIRLVGDRDTWTWQYGDRSKFFHRGLQAEDTLPESPVWYDAWKSTRWLEKRGVVIEAGLEQQAKETIEQCSFVTTFHGYRCLVMNASVPFLEAASTLRSLRPAMTSGCLLDSLMVAG